MTSDGNNFKDFKGRSGIFDNGGTKIK